MLLRGASRRCLSVTSTSLVDRRPFSGPPAHCIGRRRGVFLGSTLRGSIWDIDGYMGLPTGLPILGRAGHREEIKGAADKPAPVLPAIRLKAIGGFDMGQGLRQTVYSGG